MDKVKRYPCRMFNENGDWVDFHGCFDTDVSVLESEIERLEKKIPIVSVDRSEICFDGKGYTEDEQLERMKAKLESMRCCGNCSEQDWCKTLIDGFGCCDNWQPKENN